MKPQKATDLWQTPPEEIDFVRRVFGGTIDLDPCASTDGDVLIQEKDGTRRIYSRATNHATANLDITKNGLAAIWFGNVFVNPPYSQLLTWAEVCVRWGAKDGVNVLALVPATPATQWWQVWAARAQAICLCAKRVCFLDHEGRPGKNPRHDVAWVFWGAAAVADDLHTLSIAEGKGCVVRPYEAPSFRATQHDLFFGREAGVSGTGTNG